MRLLVISDTHKKLSDVIDLLSGDHRFDAVLHLGDLIKDAEDIESMFDLPVYYVAGNCDWGASASVQQRIVEFEGVRIFMTHGHHYRVKHSDGLLRKIAKKENFDVVLYGHSHQASVTYEGNCIIMNPGSISLPRDGKKSFGVIHIDSTKKIHTNIVRLP